MYANDIETYDVYETMNDKYQISKHSEIQNENPTFFSIRELSNPDMTLKKNDTHTPVKSTPPVPMTQIRSYRPVLESQDYSFTDTKQSNCNSTMCSIDFSSKPKTTPLIDYSLCPICNTKAVKTCRCQKKDSICANHHEWHVDSQGRMRMGLSHV